MYLFKNWHIFLIGLFLIFFSSCSQRVLYLQDLNLPPDVLHTNYQPYKLKPYDYLYITITSTDESVNKMFNDFLKTSNNRLINNNLANYYFSGYMINDTGYVYIPILGAVKAQGLTVEQFRDSLQKVVDSYFNNTLVNVKLISYNVYFVGEVNTRVIFYQDRVNILQALSQIGGLPNTADKKQIYLIRQQDSTYKVYTIDLTTKKIFYNKNFYLQPNDIIYVKPRPVRVPLLQIQDYLTYISVISSSLSFIMFLLTILSKK